MEIPKYVITTFAIDTHGTTATITCVNTRPLPPIEEFMEPMCDQCQWPGWYKDPDDLQREKCSDCPVERKLSEVLYGET